MLSITSRENIVPFQNLSWCNGVIILVKLTVYGRKNRVIFVSTSIKLKLHNLHLNHYYRCSTVLSVNTVIKTKKASENGHLHGH